MKTAFLVVATVWLLANLAGPLQSDEPSSGSERDAGAGPPSTEEPVQKDLLDAPPDLPVGSSAERTIAITRDGTFVQPDYSRWQQLKVGMTEDEVIKILGPPLSGREPAAREGQDEVEHGLPAHDRVGFSWRYGWLSFSHPAFPKPVYFSVLIQKNRVLDLSDPFRQRFSSDGKPTVPELVVPANQTEFDVHPRFIDMRWIPSSGVYPIEYEVALEIGQKNRKSDGKWATEYRQKKNLKASAPYAAASFPSNPARWRVRASNSLGTSEWSEYRYFSFRPDGPNAISKMAASEPASAAGPVPPEVDMGMMVPESKKNIRPRGRQK